ncbi:hypothetical protein ACHAWU_009015 [Discostella pseudostelligera]|uniref:Methyltransferase type 11 domain-containing protein n=1 Tax=Discostella pseudostelligera TaxID=259834 RepID=A0ABD3MMU3_9STRA
MASYGKKSYWNERYARETEPCDWIVNDYSIFQQLFSPRILNHVASPPGGEIFIRHLNALPGYQQYISPVDGEANEKDWKQRESQEFPSSDTCRVLHIGCGNSQLGEYMLQSGFTDIVNVDYSEVVIKMMQEKYNDDYFEELSSCIQRKGLLSDTPKLESRDDGSSLSATRTQPMPKMTFQVGDITEGLGYPDESFDLIICKKTLDVILCSVGSTTNAKSMMAECFRLLNKEHGVLMILSSAKPEDRAYYFEQDPWSGVENIKLPSIDDGFDQRKSHERKRIDSYAYILYKQSSRFQVDVDSGLGMID